MHITAIFADLHPVLINIFTVQPVALDWGIPYADLFTDMDVTLTLNNVNRAHRIGPRTSITNRQHSRQVIIQFKDMNQKQHLWKPGSTFAANSRQSSSLKISHRKEQDFSTYAGKKSENTSFRTAGPMMGESSPRTRTAELKQSLVRKTWMNYKSVG